MQSGCGGGTMHRTILEKRRSVHPNSCNPDVPDRRHLDDPGLLLGVERGPQEEGPSAAAEGEQQ